MARAEDTARERIGDKEDADEEATAPAEATAARAAVQVIVGQAQDKRGKVTEAGGRRSRRYPPTYPTQVNPGSDRARAKLESTKNQDTTVSEVTSRESRMKKNKNKGSNRQSKRYDTDNKNENELRSEHQRITNMKKTMENNQPKQIGVKNKKVSETNETNFNRYHVSHSLRTPTDHQNEFWSTRKSTHPQSYIFSDHQAVTGSPKCILVPPTVRSKGRGGTIYRNKRTMDSEAPREFNFRTEQKDPTQSGTFNSNSLFQTIQPKPHHPAPRPPLRHLPTPPFRQVAPF